ncbi:hypothetical protein RHMOL_Rhmol13G0111400 [Rhododendron molle]|uniref:Uncharacterized protein n=1 Tax=Rhododendron molle TaxID=49168 RepID=A0ACC0L5G3_RHOML|nr:hypothetical protein RHMOL_Rhmol13G0111400 [Rhododendron molle]
MAVSLWFGFSMAAAGWLRFSWMVYSWSSLCVEFRPAAFLRSHSGEGPAVRLLWSAGFLPPTATFGSGRIGLTARLDPPVVCTVVAAVVVRVLGVGLGGPVQVGPVFGLLSVWALLYYLGDGLDFIVSIL